MSNGLRTMASALAALQAHQAQVPTIRIAGIQALNRLVPIALRNSGQSRVLGRFLLGLYNGEEFPFDLTDLRGLDLALFKDCLSALMMDYSPDKEVHERIQGGSAIWQLLIEQWAPEVLSE